MFRKKIVELVCLALTITGCTSVAPGMQFSTNHTGTKDDEHPRTEIVSITSALVRKEKEVRERQVANDLSSLISNAKPYLVEAGDILQIVVWDHPELSASDPR